MRMRGKNETFRRPLDEYNENYGYGILNVQTNQFVMILNGGPLGNDCDIVDDKQKLIKHFLEISEDASTASELSHLRVVKINLDNELDEKALSKWRAKKNNEE